MLSLQATGGFHNTLNLRGFKYGPYSNSGNHRVYDLMHCLLPTSIEDISNEKDKRPLGLAPHNDTACKRILDILWALHKGSTGNDDDNICM
jgi:hypothetical protein